MAIINTPSNITGNTFVQQGLVNVAKAVNLLRIEDEPTDEAIKKSLLGHPVYSNLTINENPDEEISEVQVDDCVFTINQNRNIVVTPIAGRNGTVKEYISDGDYLITVVGRLVSPYANVFPSDQMQELIRHFRVQRQIEVSSNFLLNFDITAVVVQDYTFAEVQGSRNQVTFFVNLLSDVPIEVSEF